MDDSPGAVENSYQNVLDDKSNKTTSLLDKENALKKQELWQQKR